MTANSYSAVMGSQTVKRLSGEINYVRERSSGEIVRDSLRIYRNHFGTIFGLYFISGFLWQFIYEILDATGSSQRVKYIFYGLSYLMSFVAGALLTAAVAQIYVGYELNLKRIVRRRQILGKALITALLALILFPLYPLFLFSVPVAILEGAWGFKALKRSRELGRHYYGRNFLVYLWPYTAKFLVWLAYGILVFILPSSLRWRLTLFAIKDIVFSLIMPLSYITAVLLYFDMRIRNEGYDIVSLAEELKK